MQYMQNKNTRIYLIGFMGSGKSYTGNLLAKRLGWTFVDLDAAIETAQGRSISSIFAGSGEQAFRRIEQTELHKTGAMGQAVVSCGGGLPCFFDNMEWMNRHGRTVFLNASPGLLFKRLSGESGIRPLLRNLHGEALFTFISDKLKERLPFYEMADLKIDLDPDKENALAQIQKILPFVISENNTDQ